MEKENQNVCTGCSVPLDLHGTCCGWENAKKFITDTNLNLASSVYTTPPDFSHVLVDFNMIKDLRSFLLKHPDQEMVRASCLHYLGDKFQSYDHENK